MASNLKLLAAALATAGLLAACGGGGGADTTPKAKVSSVKVVGDSLSDSGTFGFKFTVQGAAPTGANSFQVWTERVADQFGQTLCAHYSTTAAPKADCNNYAVGGAVINPASVTVTSPELAAFQPMSILQQIKDASAAGLSANDLVLVDGGANDTAALILSAAAQSQLPPATTGPFFNLIGTLVDQATQGALLQKAGGDSKTFIALAGSAYMTALAQKLATAVQTGMLDKGVTHVAVLNLPKLTLTPRIKTMLAGIQQQTAAGAAALGADAATAAAAGQKAAAAQGALIDAWVQAFNTQLNTNLGADARVAIIDFYTGLEGQVAAPEQYGYTNVTTPACPSTGVDATTHLPSYTLQTCTTAQLLAKNPAANWWDGYSFADDQHPTPYGHMQMSQLAARALAKAGWL